MEALWSGPLPPPAALAAFNDAFAGCAERIVAMAERQSLHRQEMEGLAIRAKARGETFGHFSAFVLAAGAIACGTLLAWNGKETSGLGTIIAALVALVSVFVAGRWAQDRDLQRKREAERQRR